MEQLVPSGEGEAEAEEAPAEEPADEAPAPAEEAPPAAVPVRGAPPELARVAGVRVSASGLLPETNLPTRDDTGNSSQRVPKYFDCI